MEQEPIASKDLRLSAEQVAGISRALADPRRFAMLRQIAAHEALPCAGLEAHACLTPPTISHHLRELQAVGLIAVEREGRGMRLSLDRKVWAAYLHELAAF